MRTSHECSVLSTHMHRYCKGCDCQCHEMMSKANYEKNNPQKVKRV